MLDCVSTRFTRSGHGARKRGPGESSAAGTLASGCPGFEKIDWKASFFLIFHFFE
jgi:hypothetical protein